MSGKHTEECKGCRWSWSDGAFRCHHCSRFKLDKPLPDYDVHPIFDRYDDSKYIEPWNIDEYLEN